MNRRLLFYWARLVGWLKSAWNKWWAKPLAILLIVTTVAWTVDFIYFKYLNQSPEKTKKEKTIEDTRTTTSQEKSGGPEVIKTNTTTTTIRKEPNKTETTRIETTKTETTIKGPNKTEVRKTETSKTDQEKTETTKPDGTITQSDKNKTAQKNKTLLFSFWKIVGLYALVLFFWWGFQSRRQLVVEEFTTFTKNPLEKKERKDLQGLGALLAVELDRLKRLYRTVDEQRAVSTATGIERPLEVAFKGEDVSSLLKGAVSADSKLGLGPLTIPAGSIMSLLGLIFRGPRLSGSLHVEEVGGKWERYTLAAQFVGGDRPLSWDVAKEIAKTPTAKIEPDKKEKSQTSNLQGGKTPTFIYGLLVEELAYRVFTDLALSPNTVRWEATRAFSKGLRAYRDCLRTSKDSTLNLKRAEHHLMEAISIDEKMDLAYYNLGVVYTELARREAAAAAFTMALELNKGRWEAAYGLARAYYKKIKEKEDFQNTFREMIKWCERVSELQPKDARVPNLKGLAYIKRALEAKKARDADWASTSIQEDFQSSIQYFFEAVNLSRRSFFRAVKRGELASASDRHSLRQQHEVFISCLHNLAMAHLESAKLMDNQADKLAKCREAEHLLNEAWYFQSHTKLRMESLIPHLHSALGKIYLEKRQYDQALEHLGKASRIDPATPMHWAYQGLTLALANKPDEEIEAVCNKFLDSLDITEAQRRTVSDRIKVLIREYGPHNNIHLQRLAGIGNFSEKLKKQEDNAEFLCSKFDDLKNNKNKVWECAQVAIKLGKLLLRNERPEEAARYYQVALEKLQADYPQEIRRQELRACLAQCRRSMPVRRDKEINLLEELKALEDINQALGMNPLSSVLRKELGCIYFSLCRFAEARDALEDALFWDANDPEIYHFLGLSHFHLVRTSRDPRQGSRRTEGLEKASEYLMNALALYGPEKTAGPEEVKKSHQIGRTHYWLGQVSLELNRPESAITSLMIAGNLQAALEQAPSGQGSLEPAAQQISLDKKIPLDTQLLLGVAFLKNKNFNEAENLFQELIRKYGTKPEKLELLIEARLHYAFSLAERRGDLKTALKQIEETEKDLDKLASKPKKLEACCRDYEGWIRYKKDEIDQAIDCLESAVSLHADAGSYYRLALAYKAKWDENESKQDDNKDKSAKASPAERKKLLKKALECCQHVEDLDFRQEYKEGLKNLKERLEKPLKGLEDAASAEGSNNEENGDV